MWSLAKYKVPDLGFASNKTYPYEKLVSTKIPEDVDPTRKEEYLSDVEFQQVSGHFIPGIFNPKLQSLAFQPNTDKNNLDDSY